MAWPGTLTLEEQEIVMEFDKQMRSAALELVGALNLCKGVYDTYWGQVTTLFGKLSDDDLIPKTSNLAGSETLTKEDHVTVFLAYITSALEQNTQAHRNNWVRAIGGVNMLRV